MNRSNSLDALRGLAILLMVLSGSIAFGGVLPAWMYHAQVPPPAHVFNETLPGITWVDVVFPFFLFSLGAAIPLALNRKINSQPTWKVLVHLLQRYGLLILFAIFTVHAGLAGVKSLPAFAGSLISILCYLLLYAMYAHSAAWQGKWPIILKVAGFVIVIAFLALYPFADGFSLYKSDVIIVVLANMALFASLIWWVTASKPLLRIGILPFIMAVLLTANNSEAWNAVVFNWSPLPWLYKFTYLKYLFIVLPGTLAGEWLSQFSQSAASAKFTTKRNYWLVIAVLLCALLVGNIINLYARLLVFNLFFSVVVCSVIVYLTKQIKESADKTLLVKLINAGIYLLLLGLFFEAYEGGIKKDYATYSFYFVTTGLAFITLAALQITERAGFLIKPLKYLGDNGKNPMIAYTTGNLLLMPLLKITGGIQLFDALSTNPVGGFMRGVLFTGVVSVITVYCTRKKLYWKT